MYTINKTATEFYVTFSGNITMADIKRWQVQSIVSLATAINSFGLILDFKDVTAFLPDAQYALLEGCKIYKQKGMKRSAMIVAQPALARQFRRMAQQAGSSSWERYIDTYTNPNAVHAAEDWVRKGVDPDPPLRGVVATVPVLGLISSRNNTEIDLEGCMTLAASEIFESAFAVKPKLVQSQNTHGDDDHLMGTSSDTLTGNVSLQLTDAAARHLAGAMRGVSADEAGTDAEVTDCIGELFTILSARFRGILGEAGLMCVPGTLSVKRSDQLTLQKPAGSFSKQLIFDCMGQPVSIEIHTHFSRPAKPVQPLEQAKILVVDSNEAIRALVAKAFDAYECEVFHAANKVRAMEIVTALKPDAIFLDVLLPEMGTLAILAKLRGDPKFKDIAVVLISTATGALQKPNPPVVGFLVKPFLDAQVIASLKNLVKLRSRPGPVPDGGGTPPAVPPTTPAEKTIIQLSQFSG